jgi:hypothetical protein
LSCNCRRDPKTRVCPAWRTIRRDLIRSQYLDGVRLRDIADAWGMNHIGSVINQIGDAYDHRWYPVPTYKTVIAERQDEIRVFCPIIRVKDSGFTVSSVYAAVRSGGPYAGYTWRLG